MFSDLTVLDTKQVIKGGMNITPIPLTNRLDTELNQHHTEYYGMSQDQYI
jgi:hypothetical protein